MKSTVTVWYYTRSAMKNDPVGLGLCGKVDKTTLSNTHREVYQTKEEVPEDRVPFLEEYFHKFNVYEENPLSHENSPDKQQFIKENQLHTSMSVGDVIEIHNGETLETWVCEGVGWNKI